MDNRSGCPGKLPHPETLKDASKTPKCPHRTRSRLVWEGAHLWVAHVFENMDNATDLSEHISGLVKPFEAVSRDLRSTEVLLSVNSTCPGPSDTIGKAKSIEAELIPEARWVSVLQRTAVCGLYQLDLRKDTTLVSEVREACVCVCVFN